MGAALVGGLLEGGWEADTLSIAEIDGERRSALELQFPNVRVVPSAAWAVADADVVVVAVKPGDVEATLAIALPALGADTLMLSIAAGVTIATLEALVPDRPVVRAMPNTPALVGIGASAIASGSHATADHLDLAERLLGAVGIVVRVGEPALDAVTGLSGSGPAYVFLVAEAMIEAGVLVGLSSVGRADVARFGDVARPRWIRSRGATRPGHVARRHDRRRTARARNARPPRGHPRCGERGGAALARTRRRVARRSVP
jgi:pyrroline-5-carboxylate reductase